MSNTTDQFFEDEEDLAREQSAAGRKDRKGRPAAVSDKPVAGKPAGKARAATPAAGGKGAAKPPTFGMVVAIAAVALVLGVCIGYFFAMSVVDKTRSAGTGATTTAATTSTSTSASTSDSADDSSGLPSGHPDLSTFMNADGTVNEEALAEYRAKKAAEEAEAEGASEAEGTSETAGTDAADASKAAAETADASGSTGASGSSDGK